MEHTLIIDAASPTIAVGFVAGAGERPQWHEARDEAGVALFRAVDEVLRSRDLSVADLTTVAFCEGPGSLLGVRLVAMALRTWAALPRAKPLRIQGYRSLELIAAHLLAGGRSGPFRVITDGRRSTWNTLEVGADGRFAAIRRCPAAERGPAAEPVYHPRGFPLWQALPAAAQEVAYEPRDLPLLAERFPLLREIEAPDAFMTEMPTYREWIPEHPVRPA